MAARAALGGARGSQADDVVDAEFKDANERVRPER